MAFINRFLVLLSVFYSVDCLRCYTCSGESSNSDCSAVEHLVECDRTQDACLTSVIWSSVDGKTITKFCYWQVECPTALQSPWPCDTRENAWACGSCCTDNDCNYSDTSAAFKNFGHSFSIFVLSVLCLFCVL
ncbi:uncharacterized protein LOC100375274 [Saccoglossus kowalevskii]|uniref:Uncharacterized protein LOC100375274 n=1 Tax=Saccoglossus kowalevskii TaxID=10224 RepID=A0ABM0GRC8_SACKO|nr:PREDICTED: uncharacterized protein LOC100375274 [Saccoglossus kowalevskii]